MPITLPGFTNYKRMKGNTELILYIRDKKRRITGILTGTKIEGSVRISYFKLNPKYGYKSKSELKTIIRNRVRLTSLGLCGTEFYFLNRKREIVDTEIPNQIKYQLPYFILRCFRYFKVDYISNIYMLNFHDKVLSRSTFDDGRFKTHLDAYWDAHPRKEVPFE